MSTKTRAAIEGWHTMDSKTPQLIGTRCGACGTCYFPAQTTYCRNPACDSSEFEELPLSRTGKIWSYTNACYQPPEPYVAADPFVPFSIAAVELEDEAMIILGQVVKGVGVEDLKVGMPVELVLEPLFSDDDGDALTWKWRPLRGKTS